MRLEEERVRVVVTMHALIGAVLGKEVCQLRAAGNGSETAVVTAFLFVHRRRQWRRSLMAHHETRH